MDGSRSDFFQKNKNNNLKLINFYYSYKVMRGEPFNEKADVYSFSLILWQLTTVLG